MATRDRSLYLGIALVLVCAFTFFPLLKFEVSNPGLGLALHVLNTGLAWLCLRRLGVSAASAALATLVFALHPLQVEAVAYGAVRERLAAVSLMFAAFWLWVSRRPMARSLSAVIAVLACYLYLGPLDFGRGLGEWAVGYADGVVLGLAKFLMPVGLAPDYGSRSPMAQWPWLSALALALFGVLLWRRRDNRRFLLGAALFFFSCFAGDGTFHDGLLYAGLFGAALALAARIPNPRPVWVALAAVVGFGVCRGQLRHWRNERTLSERTARVSPSAENRHRYGLALRRAGESPLAVQVLGEAASQNPWEPVYANDLAIALVELGRFDEAEHELRAALAWSPDSPTLNRNLQVLGRGLAAAGAERHP